AFRFVLVGNPGLHLALPGPGAVTDYFDRLAGNYGIAFQRAADVATVCRGGHRDVAACRTCPEAKVSHIEGSGIVGDDLGLERRLAAGDVRKAGSELAADRIVLVRRYGYGSEQGDDRDDDHQLDQGEAAVRTHGFPLWQFLKYAR